MCFSATASFVASGVLVGASVVTLRSLRNKPLKLFAFIPLIFAIHQAIEGFQWLAINDGQPNLLLGYAFAGIAYLFWPVFIPLAALQVEQEVTRRKLILLCLLAGIFSVITLGYALFTQPLVVEVIGHSIRYDVNASATILLPIAYVISVTASGLLVRRFWLQMFGALGLVGLVISYVNYTSAYQSVWCFFAAILSFCIIMDLHQANKTLNTK
jgi:hypothetical protein